MSSIHVIRNICLSIYLPSTMIGMATKVNLSPLMSNLLYNAWGQRTHVKIGSTNLATYHYSQDSNRYLDRLEFGNGDVVQYGYDDLGRVRKENYYDGSALSRTIKQN